MSQLKVNDYSRVLVEAYCSDTSTTTNTHIAEKSGEVDG